MKWLLALFLFFSFSPCFAIGLTDQPKLRNAVVLIHGATEQGSRLKIGFLDFGPYFRKIKEFYSHTGTDVRVVEMGTDGSIGERAAILKNYLETEMRGKMVNVVAHSLGGLDARYAVSVLGVNQIASITTIGTPHHGSPLADWAVKQTRRKRPWYWIFRVLGYNMERRKFLPELTTSYMRDIFNRKVLNRSDVRYFSVRTRAAFRDGSMSYMLWFTSRWLESERHPLSASGHDGLVPYDSQKWGQEVATLNLDHLAQINHHEFRVVDYQQESLNLYRAVYYNLVRENL